MQHLDDLYLLARVIESGGFTAAERATGIPKSRLSRRVAALEQRLGVRLIQRSAHSFAVTPVGEVVYGHARRMVGEAEAAEAAAGEALSEPSGLVRVSGSVMMGELVLAGLLADFAALHPKVRIALSLTDRFVDLAAERIDLAIRAAGGPLANSDLVARRVWSSRMIVVASPELLARCGAPTHPDELDERACIGFGSADTTRKWVFQTPAGEAVERSVDARLCIDNLVALAQAAVHGFGFAQVPDYTCHRELTTGALRQVLVDWAPPRAPIYAVYPSRRGVTAAVRLLIDFVGERLAEIDRACAAVSTT